MSRQRTFWLVFALALVGGLVVLATALRQGLDAGLFKQRLETEASRALGMELRIGGDVNFTLRPGLALTLGDVHVRNRDAEIAVTKQVTLGVEALPLLLGELRVTSLALSEPRLLIERALDGRFNIEPAAAADAAAATLPALSWPRVSVSGASFSYADKRWANRIDAVDCRIDMQDLRVASASLAKLVNDASFTAEVACGEFRHGAIKVSDLKLKADAKHGVLEFKALTAQAFDAPGTGEFVADFSGAQPIYRLDCSFKQVPIEELLKALSLQPAATGRVDFVASLSTQGRSGPELRQALAGHLTLRGHQLTLNGRDLDEALSRFESSQRFSLVDAGAFFIVGPLGLVLTKGYDFANAYRGAGGTSAIQTLVSDWQFEHGVARAQDVAMATAKYRIALHGGLDVVHERFDDVSLALVDAEGCVTVQQRITGSFQKPVVEEPNLLHALAGPALSLLRKARDLLPGAACNVFYAGSVPAPA